jgi:hypothetical protein
MTETTLKMSLLFGKYSGLAKIDAFIDWKSFYTI